MPRGLRARRLAPAPMPGAIGFGLAGKSMTKGRPILSPDLR
jgi:hypothetical protein